jgi:hypothetical protein
MIQIPLDKGKVALIDDEDAVKVAQFRWYARYGNKTWYAQTWVVIDGKKKPIEMHALILPAPRGMQRDHRDGNGLNNTKNNLRIGTRSQNQGNRSINKNNTSGFKGVHYIKKGLKHWRARINIGGRRTVVGDFLDPRDAAKAYDDAAIQIYGEFARTNAMEGRL